MTDGLPRPLLAAVGALTQVRRVPALVLAVPLSALVAVDRARRSYEALVERGEQVVNDRFGDTESGASLPVVPAPTESNRVLDAVSHVVDPLDTPHTKHKDPVPDGDAPLPDFDRMTLGALRGSIRGLPSQKLQELLDYEQAHQARPPVVQLLEHRIATLAVP